MCIIEWIRKLMVTTWDTYCLIYMGTIVLWLTIVCSRKHTSFLTSNKLTMNEENEMKRRQITPKLLTFNMDQRFYRGSKQPMSPWSKLYLVLKQWKAMVN
jgi:hypothetical protein